MILSTAAAWAQDTAAGLERLLELGRAIRSNSCWTAEYDQEYRAPGMTIGDEVEGSVWIAWPDRAHFETGKPLQRTMGMNGRNVRLIDHEISSCDEHRLSAEEWARIPLAAVLDPSRAVQRFSVLEHGDDGFALEPLDPEGVKRVEVRLGKRGMPLEVVIIDPQGATNRLRFIKWKKTTPPARGWLPEPPDGVECSGDLGASELQ